MKRRDFVRTAISLPLVANMASDPSEVVSYFDEESAPAGVMSEEAYHLHFMAVGDWGRNGEYLQAEVAGTMGRWATENRTHFVISTGDNFYPKGVISEHDPLWHYSFENIYTAHALQCDWYPILGNHDYGADPDAQVRYSGISRRWKMPSRYYSREISLGKGRGTALFVMLDTNPMVDEDRIEETQAQLNWLDATLSKASADTKWKIVVGHHPAYTVGPRIQHRHVLLIRETFADIFTRNKVDVYLSGHEHSLQHLKADGFTHQIISGAGSELTPVSQGISYSKFEASANGFLYASVNSEKLNFKMVDHLGEVLYETTLRR